jgi:hypothetical protein
MKLMLLLCTISQCGWYPYTTTFDIVNPGAVISLSETACKDMGKFLMMTHGGNYPHNTAPRYVVRDFRCEPK